MAVQLVVYPTSPMSVGDIVRHVDKARGSTTYHRSLFFRSYGDIEVRMVDTRLENVLIPGEVPPCFDDVADPDDAEGA